GRCAAASYPPDDQGDHDHTLSSPRSCGPEFLSVRPARMRRGAWVTTPFYSLYASGAEKCARSESYCPEERNVPPEERSRRYGCRGRVGPDGPSHQSMIAVSSRRSA